MLNAFPNFLDFSMWNFELEIDSIYREAEAFSGLHRITVTFIVFRFKGRNTRDLSFELDWPQQHQYEIDDQKFHRPNKQMKLAKFDAIFSLMAKAILWSNNKLNLAQMAIHRK